MSTQADLNQLSEHIATEGAWIAAVRREVGSVVVGQQALIDRLLIGLLTGGHVLLEGVPGLAKTLSVRTLAGALQAQFARIQFTPDLLPADIVGTLIYNPQKGTFETKLGPIFANIVLADEINRAPAKVQSALLEAMQEKQVTLGEHTHNLPVPFLVLATENPIDQEGTYPLPEAQVDRFMLKVRVGYPTRKEERIILDTMATSKPKTDVQGLVSAEELMRAREIVDHIYIDDKVREYLVDLVHATRTPREYGLKIGPYLQYGASPRATIALAQASRAWAFIQGRAYVTPQDIKDIGTDVMAHRLVLTYEAEAEGITREQIVNDIFDHIPVP